jgi:hypothetical protein
MGLLMRKLDAARLQPPPDGACSSTGLGLQPETDMAYASNDMLFSGVAATAHRGKAAVSLRVHAQGGC